MKALILALLTLFGGFVLLLALLAHIPPTSHPFVAPQGSAVPPSSRSDAELPIMAPIGPLARSPQLGRARLELRVTNPLGHPLSGVPCAVGLPNLESPVPVLSSRDGKVGFDIPVSCPAELRLGGRDCAPEVFRIAALSTGETRDLGDVHLSRAGSVVGRVTDPSGAPMSGVELHVSTRVFVLPGVVGAQPGSGGRGEPAPEARTDERGRFEIAGLTPGTYSMTATHPGSCGVEVNLHVKAGTKTTVDLRMRAGRELCGVVRDDSGAPLGGARVALVPGRWLGSRTSPSVTMLEAALDRGGVTTGPDGRFVLTGAVLVDQAVVAYAADKSLLLRRKASLDEELELVLQSTRTLHGRVRDHRGDPVPGAMLWVCSWSSGGEEVLVYEGEARANEEGHFELQRVPLGALRLRAAAAAGRAALGPVVVHEGELLDVRLRGERRSTFRVLDADQQGQPGLLVELRPSVEKSPREEGEPWALLVVPTCDAGRATFFDLEPGTWKIRVLRGVESLLEREIELTEEETIDVDVILEPGGLLSVRVIDRAGSSVPHAPLVLRRSDGLGQLEEVLLRADAFGWVSSGRLSPGSYTLAFDADCELRHRVASASQGSYRVTPSMLRVEVLPGQSTSAVLRLTEECLLRVQVLRSGRAAAHSYIGVERADDPANLALQLYRSAEESTTDAAGAATLTLLRPGSYILYVRSSRHAPPTAMVVDVVPGPQEFRVEIATGRVQGVVLDHNNASLANAIVRLRPVGEAGLGGFGLCRLSGRLCPGGEQADAVYFETVLGETALRTNAEGRFCFEDVSVNRYEIVVDREGYASRVLDPFELGPGEFLDLGRLSLSAACVLEGQVRGFAELHDPEWGPGLVELLDGRGELVERCALDRDGAFRFDRLSSGTHVLIFRYKDRELRDGPFEIRVGVVNTRELCLPESVTHGSREADQGTPSGDTGSAGAAESRTQR